jgi:hypothetical protein
MIQLKLRINESNYLLEDIAAVKKYYPNIDDNTFMQLIQLDPTYKDGSNSVGKYGKWILNLFNKGNLSQEDFSDVTPLLNQFSTYRNRVPNKDLNSYKTLDDLESILADVVDDDSMLSDRQKLRFMKNVKAGRVKVSAEDDYDVPFEDDKFIVYVPNTHEASMKLGSGTKWCTAHENPDWYNKYTGNGGKLYIIRDKSSSNLYQYSDSTNDILNAEDDEFNWQSVFKKDKNFMAFMNKISSGFFPKDIPRVRGNTATCQAYDHLSEAQQKKAINIIIPDGTDEIYPSAFKNAHDIESVLIPNGVSVIGANAFSYCWHLGDNDGDGTVIIPSTVRYIGFGAFFACYGIGHISIPNGVESIEENTFSECMSLSEVNIPNSVVRICDSAFSSCYDLKAIMIPDSVAYMGKDVFYECDGLIVYTDNDYVIKYCADNNIQVMPTNKFRNESIVSHNRLRIFEDTCCITSKTSYMDSGLDDNGIYYFGKKPEKPMNWKDYKRKKVKLERIDSTMVKKLRESDEMMTTYLTVDSKSVPDSDGFMTDYTWYARIRCTADEWYKWLKSRSAYNTHTLGDIPDEYIDGYVFVFGDSDLYTPEDGEYDYECDSYEEATEWFEDYRGFEDDEEHY